MAPLPHAYEWCVPLESRSKCLNQDTKKRIACRYGARPWKSNVVSSNRTHCNRTIRRRTAILLCVIPLRSGCNTAIQRSATGKRQNYLLCTKSDTLTRFVVVHWLSFQSMGSRLTNRGSDGPSSLRSRANILVRRSSPGTLAWCTYSQRLRGNTFQWFCRRNKVDPTPTTSFTTGAK